MSDITVTLRARNSELKTGLAEAKRDVQQWARETERAGAGVGGVFGRIAGGIRGIAAGAGLALGIGTLGRLAREAIDYASEVSDAAEATRTTVAEFQALRAEAALAGVGPEKLEKALSNLGLRTQKAIEENGALADSFARLGIEARTFENLSTAQKLEAVARAYVQLAGSESAVLAVTEILGEKATPRLLQVLRQVGNEGVDAIVKFQTQMGTVSSDPAISNVDKLGDAWGIVWRQIVRATGAAEDFLSQRVSGGLSGPSGDAGLWDPIVYGRRLLEGSKARDREGQYMAALRVLREQPEFSRLSAEGFRKLESGVRYDPERVFRDLDRGGQVEVRGGGFFAGMPLRFGSVQPGAATAALAEEARLSREAAEAEQEKARSAQILAEQRVQAIKTERVNAAYDEARERLDIRKLATAERIEALTARIGDLEDQRQDDSLPVEQRLKAVQEIEKVEREILQLKEDQASAEERRINKVLDEAIRRAKDEESRQQAIARREETLAEREFQMQLRLMPRDQQRNVLQGRIEKLNKQIGAAGTEEEALGFREKRQSLLEQLLGLDSGTKSAGSFRIDSLREIGGGLRGVNYGAVGGQILNTEAEKQTTLQREMLAQLKILAGGAQGGPLVTREARFN
jgi:hypothetical protein